MKPSTLLILFFFTLFCALVPQVSAQDPQRAPRFINYQGKLTDAGGVALGNGQYVLRFALFPAAGGGVAVWTEEQTVSLVDGVFNVALGSATALDANAFGAATRHLETTIVSGPNGAINQTLSPRQQMVSVPFALEAQEAERAAVANISEALIEQLAKALNPPGTIITYAGSVGTDSGGLIEPVPGYLLCNGAVINGTTENGKYAALVSALGNAWGNGGNAGNSQVVNLPDLRGVFLRGWNGGATDDFVDPDRTSRVARRAGGNTGNNVGAFQMDAFQGHRHSVKRRTTSENPTNASGSGSGFLLEQWSTVSGTSSQAQDDVRGAMTDSAFGTVRVTSETRGKNANVVYLIKY